MDEPHINLPTAALPTTSEGRILFLVAAVQFVNILDFMMVMPLGPDFAAELGISTSKLGIIGGSYTAAAAVAGLAGSKYLDRFDRRSVLAVMMLGLVFGTACGGFATDISTLILARVIAGAFGGPATSIALSIVADVIPAHRRGRALGLVMGAFSVASVLGVPAGLELSRLGGWRLPFFAVAAMGLVVAALAIFAMPSLKLHLTGEHKRVDVPLLSFLSDRVVVTSLMATFTLMMASFSLIPNFAAYIQHNMHYPREHLGTLYLVGGVVSFGAMQLIGRYVDSIGAPIIAAIGTALYVTNVATTFVLEWHMPVMLMFVTFMTSMSFRGIAMHTLTSKVPRPQHRARFMSLQSATQHIASALGAVVSSQLLVELPDHRLHGMATVGTLSIALALLLPVLLTFVQRAVKRRDAAQANG